MSLASDHIGDDMARWVITLGAKLIKPKPVLLIVAGLLASVLFPTTDQAEARANAQALANTVVISEFVAINDTGLVDADGDRPDWIELLNMSNQAIDLGGWSLIDSSQRWVFPSRSIAAGDYLVVFASGKNRTGTELHTNFKLSGSGENLALANSALEQTSTFAPYPAQIADIAYGVSGGEIGFVIATPGQANGAVAQGQAGAPTGTVGRSIQTSTFVERLTSATPGAEFYYTLDGSVPTLNSPRSAGDIAINPTAQVTVLTAMAVAPGYQASSPVRLTYVNSAVVAASVSAGASVEAGLAVAPIISIVSANGAEPSSEMWEQAHLEMIDIDGQPGFSVPVGAKRVGNWSLNSDKPSFRFNFSADFGLSTLEYPVFAGYGNEFFDPATSFDKLEVRGFSADGWVHPNGSGLYLSNEFARETVLDLGTPSPLDRPASVFLNGNFLGFYSLREFPDGHWHHQSLGGEIADLEWWNIKGNSGTEELNGGQGTAWPIVREALDYQSVKDLVDARSVVNSILASSYFAKYLGGWKTVEWRVTGPSEPAHPGGLVFTMNDYDPPHERAGVYPAFGEHWANGQTFIERYATDPEFMQIMHDQTAFAFCGQGPLSAAELLSRHDALVAEAAPHIEGESLRWNVGSVATWQANVAARRAHLESAQAVVEQAWRDKGWFDGCNRAPRLDLPANLVDLADRPIELSLNAVDPERDAVTYSATGLPTGLVLDPTTGTVSGSASQPGDYAVVITATDSQANFTVAEFEWTVVASGSTVEVEVVLNEYNAVSAASGDWAGTDLVLGQRDDNGGDWIELLTTGNVDLRGWSVEIWDRDDGPERLEQRDVFTFSQHPTLAELAPGTIVVIAEQFVEDSSIDPAAGDWTLVANASSGHDSALLDPVGRGDFDSNRHELVVILRDANGNAVGPIAGETHKWRSGQNLTASHVMALCPTPTDPATIGVDDYERLADVSTFGEPNQCGDKSQELWRMRGRRLGDVDGSGTVTSVDLINLLERLVDQSSPSFDRSVADLDRSGSIDIQDAQLLAQCLADGGLCEELA